MAELFTTWHQHWNPDGFQTSRDGLRRAKQLPATSGYDGTLMGFGTMEHAALKGHYLVLREWRDGRSVQIAR